MLAAQLDEERICELIDEKLADITAFAEAKLAERVRTFEVQRPDGARVNVGRVHRQFELLTSGGTEEERRGYRAVCQGKHE